MKRFLTSLFALLVMAYAIAAVKERVQEPRDIPGSPVSSVTFKKMADKSGLKSLRDDSSIVQKGLKTRAREEKEMVHATLKFPALGEEWTMPWWDVNFYNENEDYSFEVIPYDDEGNYNFLEEQEIEIPAGTYDVLSKFEKIDLDNLFQRSHLYYYIIEQIKVDEGSIIELKPWESTVCLKMETTNPDGEKTRFRKIRYLNENYDWEIIEEGNVADVLLQQLIFCDERIIDNLSSNAGGIVVEPGPCGSFDAQENCNFYVNPVSDRYLFRSLRYMPAWPDEEKGLYLTVTQCRGSVEGIYTNNPNYSFDDSIIEASPAMEVYPPIDSDDDIARPYSISFNPVFEDGSMSSFGKAISSTMTDIWKVWTSSPSEIYNKDNLYLTYSKSLADSYIPEETEWGIWINFSETNGPKVYPFASGGMVSTVNPYGVPSLFENGNITPLKQFPGNSAYASFYTSQKIVPGESAPLLTFYSAPYFDWESEKMIDLYQYFYTGRMGENLGSCATLSMIRLKVNDEEVAYGQDETCDWIIENQDVKGEYCLQISTDNFMIDDIRGGNIAEVTYHNDNDDATPPSVTMLQFRDKNGRVDQIFDSPSDMEILISATDFETNIGAPDEWGDRPVWFNLSVPQKISAWCSATGMDSEIVHEIELNEDVEAGIAHGFGALYRGSLDNLEMMSPSGWFDLTISVEDAAGNRQVQTLYPAFKIDSLSGMGAIASDAKVRVKGNDIIAPEGSRIYNIGGTEVGNTSLPKGIYLVITPLQTVKVAIR